MQTFVTGVAGFIGFHLARRLLEEGKPVFGIDNLNAYYDPRLKSDRLAILEKMPGFSFLRADLADRQAMEEIFRTRDFEAVIHLAAQACVRYSL